MSRTDGGADSTASTTDDDATRTTRVAVVGAGVSGLAAAWHLLRGAKKRYAVTVFESEDRLGGHAYTMSIPTHGDDDDDAGLLDVDVGFMVFNDANYPNMVQWFAELGVTSEPSDMSLSVSLDGGRSLEWSSDGGLRGLFANPWQLLQPSFYRFVFEMLRFHREADTVLTYDTDDPRRYASTGEWLRSHHYDAAFGRNYLLPMMAALWSASMEDVLAFPIAQLVGFMCNHKMLRLFDRPDWCTVQGRSRSYTEKMKAFLEQHEDGTVKVSTPIRKVVRVAAGSSSSSSSNDEEFQYELFTDGGTSVGIFDHVVFACHPPTAHDMLSSDTNQTSDHATLLSLLKNIEYADNVIHLHSDPKLMPKRKAAWASWNCLGRSDLISTTLQTTTPDDHTETHHDRMKAVYVTYYLNRLQNLRTSRDFFVSLNPHAPPDPALTHRTFHLAHPQFTHKTTDARDVLARDHQGRRNLWFAGAWSGYGFHEDGCRSGFQVGTQLSGEAVPWAARGNDNNINTSQPPVLPPPDLAPTKEEVRHRNGSRLPFFPTAFTYLCRHVVLHRLRRTVQRGRLSLLDTTRNVRFGHGDDHDEKINNVLLKVMDDQFFVDFALYGDEGLARSYTAGHFTANVVPKGDAKNTTQTTTLSSPILGGNPQGLYDFLLLWNANRDDAYHNNNNSTSNMITSVASRIVALVPFKSLYARIFFFWKDRVCRLTDSLHYDNTVGLIRDQLLRCTSYDTTNNALATMTSSAVFRSIAPVGSRGPLTFHPQDTLERGRARKVTSLLARVQLDEPGMSLLVIDTGRYAAGDNDRSNWGVLVAELAAEAVRTFKCSKVHAVSPSEAQVRAARDLVKATMSGDDGDIMTFRSVKNMAKRNHRSLIAYLKQQESLYDRVLVCDTCSLVEKASSLRPTRGTLTTSSSPSGNPYTPSLFHCVDRVLKRDGVFVLETCVMNETTSGRYRYSTLPSVQGLLEAAYQGSTLTLEHVDSLGLHYARTLRAWRRKLNRAQGAASVVEDRSASSTETAASVSASSPRLDDTVWRAWNFYGAYCEVAFGTNKMNSVVMVFARPGCGGLAALNEAKAVMQNGGGGSDPWTDKEVNEWLS